LLCKRSSTSWDFRINSKCIPRSSSRKTLTEHDKAKAESKKSSRAELKANFSGEMHNMLPNKLLNDDKKQYPYLGVHAGSSWLFHVIKLEELFVLLFAIVL
jgi:hypothetical protein